MMIIKFFADKKLIKANEELRKELFNKRVELNGLQKHLDYAKQREQSLEKEVSDLQIEIKNMINDKVEKDTECFYRMLRGLFKSE